MATAALVDFDIGRKVLLELTRANIPISVAFWAHVSQLDEWQFFIATPLVDSKGHKGAYEQVLQTLHEAGMDSQLPWRRIFLRSPKDPVLRSLEKQTEIPDGTINVMESRNIPKGSSSTYYITYTPYPTETISIVNESVGDRFVEDAYLYGKMWVVSGLDQLREMLSDFLHLTRTRAESVLEEVSAKGYASVPNTRLSPRDLKRLRPA